MTGHLLPSRLTAVASRTRPAVVNSSACMCAPSIGSRRRRSPAPTAPPCPSSRPTAGGWGSSPTGSCRRCRSREAHRSRSVTLRAAAAPTGGRRLDHLRARWEYRSLADFRGGRRASDPHHAGRQEGRAQSPRTADPARRQDGALHRLHRPGIDSQQSRALARHGANADTRRESLVGALRA